MGCLETCDKLVSEEADIESLDEQGDSALISAVAFNNVEVAHWLLQKGARISYSYQREETTKKREIEKDKNHLLMKQTLSREEMSEVF